MDNGESSYRRFLAGDNEGLHEIICSYRAGLILYLNSFVQNVHTSEELTEDVFLELIIKRPKFSGKCSFKTWLYAMGRNKALDYLRKRKRQDYLPIETSFYISDKTDIESDYINDEENRFIHQCIKALKKEYADVLFLVYFEELSNEETAKTTGKSSRQVSQLLYCAKKALREEMERRREQ